MPFLWIPAALFLASFLGHVIHWSLHQPWAGRINKAHMAHHLTHYPVGRLVSKTYLRAKWWQSGAFLFTPPTALVVGLSLYLGAPWYFALTLVVYALVNDWVHDVFHIKDSKVARLMPKLRKAHFQHHRDMTKNYGIITLAWDRVFGTAAN